MVSAVKTRRTYNGALRKEQAQMTRDRILEAARRLLVSGTYSSVTMEDIAREAGVAYQTVYGIFGSKLRLAQRLIEIGFPHVSDALQLFEAVPDSAEPEVWFRTGARVNRLIYELCADLLRFMRESGDPGLLKRFREREKERLRGMTQFGVPARLKRSGRLRAGISPAEAVEMIWALSGPDQYNQLVFERGWTPSRYEQWLGDAMINSLLEPPRTRSRAAVR
jgi:AcrR family transcriptional regulator